MNSISDAELTVLYGSQTGNAEFLAYNICEDAKKVGINAELLTLNDALSAGNLAWRRLLIVTSTHDNGHMPENADAFWVWLSTLADTPYDGLPYAVLTIGDSMYDDFCKAGQDFDEAFAKLGAIPILSRMECDVDFDMTAAPWVKKFLTEAPETAPWSLTASEQIDTDAAGEFVSQAEEWHSAHIIALRALTDPASEKSAFHLTLDLPEQFEYVPGDSLDTRPLNNQVLVEEWLNAFPGVESVSIGGDVVPVREALRSRLELRIPHVGLINALVTRAIATELTAQTKRMLDAGDRQEIDAWMWGRDVLDVVQEFGLGGSALQPIVDAMRPLQFRSYSIASSPRVHHTQLGLTISSVEYEANGRAHFGTGSSHLEALLGSRVSVRRVAARDFRLPEDPDTPVIMIGPGVGIAPFIGFLEDIEARGTARDTWLFFGDQHRATEWLYQEEMTAWLASGVLTRLNLAFSRDQAEKHYVQHELLAQAEEIREWVARGAHIYICGDKNHMAHDVEEALVRVLGTDASGAVNGDGAAVLEALRAAERYVKDVY